MNGPRVVLIGGGHGLPVAIQAALTYAARLTAIVTVADDGGSSGTLRHELGVSPPGDSRNCLVAMAVNKPLADIFQFRFREDGRLQGHTVGNLVIAALEKQLGDFGAALKEAGKLLGAQGEVIPPTTEKVTMRATLLPKGEIAGQSNIANRLLPVDSVWLEPSEPAAYLPAVEAIATADQIVLGPGSVYTSVLPNLLVPGIAKALRAARVPKVFVCNTVIQPGESNDMDVLDHFSVLTRFAGPGSLDTVLASVTRYSAGQLDLLTRYKSAPVVLTATDSAGWPANIQLVEADVGSELAPSRHDPAKLGRTLRDLL